MGKGGRKDLDNCIANGYDVREEDYLVQNPVINEVYHLSWAKNRGMVWVLTYIKEPYAYMRTPKTWKSLRTKLSDLREVNRNVIKKAAKRPRINKDSES